jgi:hypothetical protein
MNSELRFAVFARDGYHCKSCNSMGPLHPHHIIFKSQGGADHPANLITVCWKCHRAIHDGFLKCELDKDDNGPVYVRFIRLRGWKP